MKLLKLSIQLVEFLYQISLRQTKYFESLYMKLMNKEIENINKSS